LYAVLLAVMISVVFNFSAVQLSEVIHSHDPHPDYTSVT